MKVEKQTLFTKHYTTLVNLLGKPKPCLRLTSYVVLTFLTFVTSTNAELMNIRCSMLAASTFNETNRPYPEMLDDDAI